jgi:single-strand DNA-binding protein
MPYSINKVTLLGNVGKDPEIRTFQNGGKVASFSLATSESWKDKTTGEKKSATEWHNIVMHGDGLVGIAEKLIKKGSKLHIEGKLETRKWEKDGVTRYTSEIVLRPYSGEIVLLDAKDAPADEPAPTE